MKKKLFDVGFNGCRVCIKPIASVLVLVLLLGSFSIVSGIGSPGKEPDVIIVKESNLGSDGQCSHQILSGPALETSSKKQDTSGNKTENSTIIFNYLFKHSEQAPQINGGDYNNDGKIDIADVVYSIIHVVTKSTTTIQKDAKLE